MGSFPSVSRRKFLKQSAGFLSGPLLLSHAVHGATPNDKIVLGCIGMGSQGRFNLTELLNFDDVLVAAVCDVVGTHRKLAKSKVDTRYGNKDCREYTDYREVLCRNDIDAVMIATPDHWHAVMSIEAMKAGKDVYCEKPETRTIHEGRRMAEVVQRYGRVFSGGSQRVWGDYHWAHKMVQGGAIGEVKEAWVNVGEPSGPCYLASQEIPPDIDWNLWLGPAPWRPYHQSLIKGGFRPFRDYSGGGTTDWGCHGFGGALFALGLHETGPIEITAPGTEHEQLTVKFADGVRIHHHGGWDTVMNFRGTEGEISEKGDRDGKKQTPPDIYIPNYKGKSKDQEGSKAIFADFLHCMRTRETPFRSIERAHRTATVCHLVNISYWLNRSLRWDPVKEEIIGDIDANRWLDRPRREPWSIA